MSAVASGGPIQGFTAHPRRRISGLGMRAHTWPGDLIRVAARMVTGFAR
jgi:hypothetical protein